MTVTDELFHDLYTINRQDFVFTYDCLNYLYFNVLKLVSHFDFCLKIINPLAYSSGRFLLAFNLRVRAYSVSFLIFTV